MKPTAIAALVFLLLSACATRPPAVWPEGAEAREFFEREYRADARNQAFQQEEDYLLWVERFYSGMPPVPGWLDMAREVLEALSGPARTEVARRLHALGATIGAEWAKDNNVRRLDSRMANVWRDALVEARRQGDIPGFLTRLEGDVAALLAGELNGGEIQFERYYTDDFDF